MRYHVVIVRLALGAALAAPTLSNSSGPTLAADSAHAASVESVQSGVEEAPGQGSVPRYARIPDDGLLDATTPSPSPTPSPSASGLAEGARPAWWYGATPRIDAVGQLDGGPYQSVNCVMASGAMLARVAYGIATTGSQLRALTDDVEGGTGFDDLALAFSRGWGVGVVSGFLNPTQLQTILSRGGGAIVVGVYAALVPELRSSRTFLGSHGVYVDAFRPATSNATAAYYVIDPLGRPSEGYRGAWWPADALEAFTFAFGGGAIDSAWAFPAAAMGLPIRSLPLAPFPGVPGSATAGDAIGSGVDGSPSPSGMPDPSGFASPPPGSSPSPDASGSAEASPSAWPDPSPSAAPGAASPTTSPTQDPTPSVTLAPTPEPTAKPTPKPTTPPTPPPSPEPPPSSEPSPTPADSPS